MTRTIFQIGLLAFFVSAVIFGLEQEGLFDSIMRAFIVFVSVELTSTLALAATAWIGGEVKNPPAGPQPQRPPRKASGPVQKNETTKAA